MNHCRSTKREELFDGLTADQLVRSVQYSARQAALQRATTRTHLSYLKENGVDSVTLHTLADHSGQSATARTVSLDALYCPAQSGRIDLNILINSPNVTGSSVTNMTPTVGSETSEEAASCGTVSNGTNSTEGEETGMASDDSYLLESVEKGKRIKELRDSLLPLYGDKELGIDYSLSITKYGQNCEYTKSLVNSLLSVLTGGRHRTVLKKFYSLLEDTFEA